MAKGRRGTVRIIAFLAAAAIGLGVLAGLYYQRSRRWERIMTNQYQHAFEELVNAVGEVETALRKSLYATTPALSGAICTEIFGKAMTAQMSLSALPFSPDRLEQTSGFISRVGDYAFALSRSGRALTPEEREGLRSLSETAGVLSGNLQDMQSRVQDGTLSLRELERTGQILPEGEAPPAWAGDGLREIEEEFPELPSLIYDGPFSQHLEGRSPKALEGLPEVGENEARKAAAAMLGVSRSRVWVTGAVEGSLPCWTFSCDEPEGATAYLSVTKQGGRILQYLSSRPVGSPAVTAEAAVETANRFLQQNGYTDMAETYHMTQDGILTVNYAWHQGEVLCYSDLVKVSVALDNGQVCGFEAAGYLHSHVQRELPAPAVDEQTGASVLPEDLTLLGQQLALIPTDGKYEVLCREYKCADANGQHVIVYVNAQTGEQQKILLLLEDESGTLTI